MKLLKSILILILMCVCTYAYAIEPGTHILNGDPEPYDIGVGKIIEVPNTFTIKYETTIHELNNKEVILKGSIDVSRKYKVIKLTLDYYILDGDDNVVRVTSLELTPTSPGFYNFEYQYPLALNLYEGEIFSLVFIVQEVPQQEV